jgi:V/A-type H+-transporting ATPase subunit I
VAADAATPADLQKQLEGLGLGVIKAPAGTETPDVELVAVTQRLAAAKGELGLVHDQAEHFAQSHLGRLRIAAEVLSWERDRYATVGIGAATDSSVVLEGWINAAKRSALEATCAEKNIAAIMSDLEPNEGEEPPVDIVNNSFIQPFEVVTRLYGMPGHKDLDPTLFLAGFFFLFFGLSLTDVGYGIFLMAVATMILTLFKVAPVVRTFAKLLLFMGLGSALVGLLFGGYLGIAPEALPSWLRAIQVFDPIGNPLPVFYLALGLGVFQVMVGMFLKIYSDAKNGELMNGILDQGPWLFVFFVAIAYLGVTTGYANFATPDQLINLIYVGLVLVVLASGRKGKTILEKVQSAALSLYNSIGYFSDILSYSRLLALGLATTALAFAVNLIAEIVSGTPVVGPVLAIVVLVIGHLFTLAVNTLGAFIHSARLQFVEFFGKFIAGTGREFKPLKRTAEHITIADE